MQTTSNANMILRVRVYIIVCITNSTRLYVLAATVIVMQQACMSAHLTYTSMKGYQTSAYHVTM